VYQKLFVIGSQNSYLSPLAIDIENAVTRRLSAGHFAVQ
jgi:hypothetical protein